MQTIDRTTSNLLHDHPSLYNHVLPDSGYLMSRFVHTILQRYQTGPRVLDVGCGLGREVRYLRDRGYAADGLDISDAMLEWARTNHPDARFIKGSQDAFGIDDQFDAILCLGSTFLYNHSIDAIRKTLREFHQHLQPNGLLLLEMRNGAYFLSPEGQQTLWTEQVEQVTLPEGQMTYTARFEIDFAAQLLERYYRWQLPGQEPLDEHLTHRLLFPQELRLLLATSGFSVEAMFDQPAPALGQLDDAVVIGGQMRGARMHVIARAQQAED